MAEKYRVYRRVKNHAPAGGQFPPTDGPMIVCDNLDGMEIEVVYFLGAGASKAFYPTLPLASELTLDYLLDPCGMLSPDENIESVEDYLKAQRWAKEKRKHTFEDVYPCLPENESPYFPRENLLLCLFDRLKLQPIDNGYDSIFSPWIERALGSGHPVLTTNYDSVIEWYLAGLPQASRRTVWLTTESHGIYVCLWGAPSPTCRQGGRRYCS